MINFEKEKRKRSSTGDGDLPKSVYPTTKRHSEEARDLKRDKS